MHPPSTDKLPRAMKDPQRELPLAVAMDEFDALLAESRSVALRTAGGERQRLMRAMKDFVASAMSFRFLDLPPELRNIIYEFSVVSEPGHRLLLPSPSRRRVDELAVQPSITRVSRQLRSESLPIFYGQNAFEARVWECQFSPLIDHLTLLEHDKHIRHIELEQEQYSLQEGYLEGLKELVIWSATTQATNLSFGFSRGGGIYGWVFWTFVAATVMLSHELKRRGATVPEIRQAFDQWVDGLVMESPYSIRRAGSRNRLCSYEEYVM